MEYMLSRKRKALVNLKNIPGWKTKRKLVIFSVDDYGNVRMASSEARKNLEQAGLNVAQNRFDRFDCLEDSRDLEQLFDSLSSVKDRRGNPAVFTAFALPANIDFDKVIESDYKEYHYELLPDTFKKLPGYENTWNLWNEGISKRMLLPQSHGREHIYLKYLRSAMLDKNEEVLSCLANKSFGALTILGKNVSYTGAFGFDSFSENETLIEIALDGLDKFEEVFGFKAEHFTAPGVYAHHILEEALISKGVKYIDALILKKEHQGDNKFSRRFNYLGKVNNVGQRYILRNCVFEPILNPSDDHINECLAEIEIAFKWNKPANISSHRVNFCGHIDSNNRDFGLKQLRKLLKKIVEKWPDVEFLTTVELGELITLNSK